MQQTKEALAAQTYLSVEDQKWCEDAIQSSPNAKKQLFSSNVLKAESQKDSSRVLAVTFKGGDVEIFGHKKWKLGSTRESKTGESVDLGLAPRPSAWFIVLHDLMALAGEDRLLGGPLPPRADDLGWVRINKNSSSWPLPAWPSFWHLDRFRFAWSRVVSEALGKKRERKESPEELVAWLAFHWARFATDVVLSNQAELEAKLHNLENLDAAWTDLEKDADLLAASEKGVDFESQELVGDWVRELKTMIRDYRTNDRSSGSAPLGQKGKRPAKRSGAVSFP